MASNASKVREQLVNNGEALADHLQNIAKRADVKGQLHNLQDRAEQASDRVKQVTPDAAKATISSAAGTVKKRPLAASAGIGAVVLAIVAILVAWAITRQGGS